MRVQPNSNRTETRREREEDYGGSASPKSLLLRGPGPGICEGDGSSPPRLYRALAAAAGGYNYMRIMQAAMGGGVAAAAPPHAEAGVVVEPLQGAGIKRQRHEARPLAAADGGHGASAPPPPSPCSSKLYTFLGFVVAPGPCRDHPFEVCPAHCTALSVCLFPRSIELRPEAWIGGDKAHGWTDRSSSQSREHAAAQQLAQTAKRPCSRAGPGRAL